MWIAYAGVLLGGAFFPDQTSELFPAKSRVLLNEIPMVYFIYRCNKMIATCPHCQSGFYIASELAGAVVTCSKCKKQVRAPDRRNRAPGLSSETNDGIPVAMPAETRAEAEEHLKNETEARFELEKKIKDSLDATAKAEFQAKIDAQARQEAEERLKQEVRHEQRLRRSC